MNTARVIVLPFLIGGAAHVLEDVPDALGVERTGLEESRLVHAAGKTVLLDAPVGTDPQLPWLVSRLAYRGWLRAQRRNDATNGTQHRERVKRGRVAIVGAGPGAADLLTLRARRLLRWADVIVHDRLVDDTVLSLSRRDAIRIDMGKWPETAQSVQHDINTELVQWAQRGYRVVRLKGGDPMVFGRGSEEAEACRIAGIPVAIVPGISSALAAPAAAGIPVTSRHVARSVAIVTAATATDPERSAAHVASVAHADTIVVLMANRRMHAVCDQLVRAGRDPATPAACIEHATLPTQRIVRATIGTMATVATQEALQSPMVLVIGPTAHEPEPVWSGVVAGPVLTDAPVLR